MEIHSKGKTPPQALLTPIPMLGNSGSIPAAKRLGLTIMPNNPVPE
ncbi:hypothetical protein SAMN04488540_10277 [Ferrimonas sediminum]|uniref:Uncharacterized protein n=1 Tax=Ferrimonas sediminum TaxID=718193 RepID=A0A1G8LIV3_9GAMM|nr:hypothetical protein SAMN04488540_10277 [Ferrimonas sediminum]